MLSIMGIAYKCYIRMVQTNIYVYFFKWNVRNKKRKQSYVVYDMFFFNSWLNIFIQ